MANLQDFSSSSAPKSAPQAAGEAPPDRAPVPSSDGSNAPDRAPDDPSSGPPSDPLNSPPGQTAPLPGRTQATDDLHQLLAILPDPLRDRLEQHESLGDLIEVVLDLGRRPEARFPNAAEYLSEEPVLRADLDRCIERVGHFGGDNRAGIEQTLHRISAIRNRRGEIVGLTCRVGRAVFGTIGTIRDLVETGRSILMLGRPGVGKTTALREIARVLADDLGKRVVIIDTSNEIAGDGDVPHPAIGRARRMQVARPELQHQVMIEAVENHMPETIVIDEIGTELEALAARTIAERGVQLVGTAHGNQLANLIKNPTLSDLIGGIQSVTLGDDEARRRGSQKTVLERKAPPTFDIAVEMQARQRWTVHEDVAATVDNLLRGRAPDCQVRTVSETGKILVTRELPTAGGATPPHPFRSRTDSASRRAATAGLDGWRSSGRMAPVPPLASPTPIDSRRTRPSATRELAADGEDALAASQAFQQLLLRESSPLDYGAEFPEVAAEEGRVRAASPEENRGVGHLHVYPYAISRHQLDQAIRLLNLPVVLTKDLDSADVVLALRSHLKNHAKLRHLAKSRQIPIHVIKSNSTSQIVRALRRMLKMDDSGEPEVVDLNLFANSGSDDELEALEEARLAVEQIVIPKGQPVELLPRSAKVRKMQHELVEHYKLNSNSFGEEPNRRLRIYPA